MMLMDPIETIAANSFRNFHAKGLDYLCLQRSPSLTVKAYFYDRPLESAPEVVCPHDHRYPFVTQVLYGRTGHHRYQAIYNSHHPTHQIFQWKTPLNGGDGFTWDGEAYLKEVRREQYVKGQQYYCRADEIHTISISTAAGLLLYQFGDVVPIGIPTKTFVSGANKAPPSLEGLYDKMGIDRANELIARMTAHTLTVYPQGGI